MTHFPLLQGFGNPSKSNSIDIQFYPPISITEFELEKKSKNLSTPCWKDFRKFGSFQPFQIRQMIESDRIDAISQRAWDVIPMQCVVGTKIANIP